MTNKKSEQSIKINGSVIGIGNVTGDHSSSHVEIKFSLFQNQIVRGEKTTEFERNPKFTADSTRAFSPHPDATFPELEHLIGHEAELSRLLKLYDYAARQNKETFVFLTGQYGYGTKALGRAFVDAIRQGHGRTAVTRFWSENNERHSRRDVRWNLGFGRWQEIFDLSPDFLKQESMFPFWGLFFQLCEKLPWLENEPLPTKPTDIPAYFRNCTQSGEPLVLLLEDFEFASSDWHNFIRYLAKEVDHALPILWIVTMHSDHPLDAIKKEFLSSAQTLTLELAEKNIAEIYHLSRVTREDIENYVALAESDVAERLHRLTDGVPILVQNLWQDWRRTNAVFQNDDDQWEMNKESPWVEYGSGRDYIRTMLDELWPHEDEAPWSAEQMYEMLALAAREGTSFTVEALAKAFEVETEKLVMGLEYLLDEPDDPGLVKGAAPVILEMRSANWKRTLERFEFSPLLVWFALITYEKPSTEKLEKYAENLRVSYSPFVEQVAEKIACLYELTHQPNLVEKYRHLIKGNDELRSLMSQAELLLEFPQGDIIYSRLYDLADQLREQYVEYLFTSWTIDFSSRLLELFETSQLKFFWDRPLSLLARSKYQQGEYESAREYYEKMLAIEEELGRKDGIANALGGLGAVARALGEYQTARGYYWKKLSIEEELGRKSGLAVALGGLGDVASSLGEYSTAREYYEKELAIEEELGRKSGIALAHGDLGKATTFLGEYQAAREHYEKMLAITEELGIKSGTAIALWGLGNVASSLGEYPAAREYYEKELAIEEKLGSKSVIASVLGSLGNVAHSLGEYQTARGYYEKMLVITEELGRKGGIADALGCLGSVSLSLGEYQTAREYYEKMLAIEEELEHKDGIAIALGGLGNVARSLREYQIARGYYEKKLVLDEESGRKDGISAALGGLGDVASSLGEYSTAREYYEKKLAIEEKMGRKYETSITLGILGIVSLSLGEYQTARGYYEKMLAIEEELGRKDGISAALGGLGNVSHSLGEYQTARGYYEKKLVLDEESGRKDGISAALGGLGNVSHSLGEYQTARGYYEKKLVLDEESGRKDGISAALGGLGDVASSLGEYSTAREYYEKKLAIEEKMGRKYETSTTLGILGIVSLSLGEYQTARGYYEKMLVIKEELGRKDGIADALGCLGSVSLSLGEYQIAREYYECALKIFEEIGSPTEQYVREEIEKLDEIIRSKHESKA